MTVSLIVLGAAVLMMIAERRMPGRAWPSWAGWWPAAAAFNAAQVAAVFLAGALWDPWLRAHRPWSADTLGLWGGALAGYVAITFVFYWWHRARHESDFLWRWFHQLHHSAERIEVATSFYKHPFELLANGLISSAVVYTLVGLGPAAAAGAVLLAGLAELLYHWNVATPYWLGFVIQRPESHCLHHESGVHAYNYGDLPLWDMLFGTFRNPRRWSARTGFVPGSERRLAELLGGVDVSR